jgi:hypothetical protein
MMMRGGINMVERVSSSMMMRMLGGGGGGGDDLRSKTSIRPSIRRYSSPCLDNELGS